MITPQTLKGFRDFLPEEAAKRQWLRNKLIEIFELWGYQPLETPTLEPLEIFIGQIGEGEKMFYQFTDPGGRKVALRYDQSVPTSRVIGQYYNQLIFPFKRYQIQNAFRAEKPQKGRYREFLQCDADIFGDPSPFADAETIALSLDVYKRLGFKNAQILISDRALMKDIPYDAIISIDKLKKIGEQGVIDEMVKKGIAKDVAQEYLRKILNIKPNEAIEIILNYLSNYGFDKTWYKFEPTIARSFSYSTGPIWEVVIPEYEAGSVLGGERYDNVVESISGIKVPATGFAIGFDRTLEAAEQLGLVENAKDVTKILIVTLSKNEYSYAITLCNNLRQKKINSEMYTTPDTKLDKQLKYADKKGIPYVAIIGPEEAKTNQVTLKNLKDRTQQKVSYDDIAAFF